MNAPSDRADTLTPPASALPLRARAADEHRARLMAGLAEALLGKPYRDTTVADIVQAARVSKRTFYEQFDSKEACLLALCEHVADAALATVIGCVDPVQDWRAQVRRSTESYLAQLQSAPALVRTLFTEVPALGPAGMAVRRRVNQRFAEFLCAQVELERAKGVKKRSLRPEIAMALVGGLHELMLQAVEEDRAHRLVELADAACELIEAVLGNLVLPE